MTTPLVSVIIPAFNAERTIGETLSSVAAQTYQNVEVIVVDDGSCDATASVVRRAASAGLRLQLLEGARSGPSTARNRAIAVARGEFVAPLDADDVWHPDFLSATVAAMTTPGPELGFVYALHRVIDERGHILTSIPAFACRGRVFRQHLLVNFVGNGSSALWRRSAMLAAGGYDIQADSQGGGEDYLLQVRVAATHPVGYVERYLVGYRRLGTSLSSDPEMQLRARLFVLSQVAGHRRRDTTLARRWSRAEAFRVAGFVNLRRRRLMPATYRLVLGMAMDPIAAGHDVQARFVHWLERRYGRSSSVQLPFFAASSRGPLEPCPGLLERRLGLLREQDDGELGDQVGMC